MDRARPLATEFTELLGVSATASARWDPFLLHVVDKSPLHARVCFPDFGHFRLTLSMCQMSETITKELFSNGSWY
jgi:hypothetical protein